jgi:hypothetical protein
MQNTHTHTHILAHTQQIQSHPQWIVEHPSSQVIIATSVYM